MRFTVLCLSDRLGMALTYAQSNRRAPSIHRKPDHSDSLSMLHAREQQHQTRQPSSPDMSNLDNNGYDRMFRYVCKTCGHGFTRPSHLKIHERIHTGLRPFVCSFCGRSFNQKCNLKKHIWAHHKSTMS